MKRADNIFTRERSNGTFEARITIDGKQYSRYGKTALEAKKKIKLILAEAEKGNVIVKTVKLNVALKDYLENIKKNKVKATTYDRAESIFKHHIHNESLGRRQVGLINTKDIQSLLDDKASQQGFSHSTVKKIHDLFGEFFRYMKAIGEINLNPMELVEMPHSSKFTHRSKKMQNLTVEQLKSVITEAEKTDCNGQPVYRYGEAIILLLNTGIRSGELRGIRKEDIDADRKILHINRNVAYAKDREKGGIKWLIGEVKTENSKRDIPLNSRALQAIKHLLQTTYNTETDYLICTNAGAIVTNSPLQKCYTAILKEAGISHMGLHSTRHTFATVILKEAEDKGQIKEVSELLGHSQVTTTYKYYINTSNEDKRNLVDQLNLLV